MKSLIKALSILSLLCFSTFTYAQIPQIITVGVDNRSETGATLKGDLRLTSEYPFGRVLFEYGRTTNYGSTTSTQNKSESGGFEQQVSGLNPNRGYNYRAVLVASDGREYYGENKTFITQSDNIENPGSSPGDNSGGDPTAIIPGVTDSDGDGIPDSIECPGIENGAICPDTDNDGKSDRFDTDSDGDGIPDSEDENRTTPDNPQSSDTFTDSSGNSCLGGETVPLREATQSGPLISQPGTIDGAGSELFTTGQRGALIGYVCPETLDEIMDEREDAINGVTVGEPNSVGGGGLIVNAPGESTGSRPQGEVDGNQIVPDCGADCGFEKLIELVENIIKFLIYLTIFATVVTFIYSGFIFLTKGNIEKARTDSKKMAANAAKGLLLTLFAWLIITSVLTLLTNTGNEEGDTNTDRFLQR